MRSYACLLVVVLSILVMPMSATAHHSRAEFATDLHELEGELVAIDWRNPHPSFELRTDGSSGEVWHVQVFGSPGSLSRTGVERDLFSVGQRLRIAGAPSRYRERYFLATHARLPDGTEAVLDYAAGPHFSGQYVGGNRGNVIDEAALKRAAGENRGLFRIWGVPSFAIAVSATRAMMAGAEFTSAALAARGKWDAVDNPITRCEPPWMPHVMFAPARRELIDDGDTITVRIGYFNGSRTIYMRNAPTVAEPPRSRMGVSVGRWEGQTLVVETSGIESPAFDGVGSLQSDAMTVVERFTVSGDESRLDYELTATDPVAFDGPVTFRMYYLALGEELDPHICGTSPGQREQRE